MNKLTLFAASAILVLGCAKNVIVSQPITVSFPEPANEITKVDLDETQKGYVEAGNNMAFRFLQQVYAQEDLVLSPLSLQFALAMTANGASKGTLAEILDFLGYGREGIDVLNAYCKKLMEQLPAVDLQVKLRLTDAILVNVEYPLLPSFQQNVQKNYYAAVENMDFSNHNQVAANINEWASRSTDGFIDKVLEPDDITDDAAAFLMNALYFKAKWAGSDFSPMFRERDTVEDKFTRADGSVKQVKYMRKTSYLRYAEMDGYRVLALPYAGGKFFMYILLPDGNDLDGLVKKLPQISWSSILGAFHQDAEVELKLPRFDIENKVYLTDPLQEMGVKKAFKPGVAEFDHLFQPIDNSYFWIEKVIQKARISVAEWGTEAAAVTVVEVDGKNAVGPGEEPKKVIFHADHPFLFVLGEATSGTILFEGAFTGR